MASIERTLRELQAWQAVGPADRRLRWRQWHVLLGVHVRVVRLRRGLVLAGDAGRWGHEGRKRLAVQDGALGALQFSVRDTASGPAVQNAPYIRAGVQPLSPQGPESIGDRVVAIQHR